MVIRVFDTFAQSSEGNVVTALFGQTIVVSRTGGLAYTGTSGFAAIFGIQTSISVSLNGEVYGSNGIDLRGAGTSIMVSESGYCYGENYAVLVGSNGYVGNDGVIQSNGYGVMLSGSNVQTINPDRLDNSGTISGHVAGVWVLCTSYINNSGEISGEYGIAGDFPELFGRVVIKNSGVIRSTTDAYAIQLFESNEEVSNSGQIIGDIELYEGNNTLNNVGLIDGFVNALGGVDSITNAGTIRGTVALGGGADTLDNEGGRIRGLIDLGDGNDTATGGDFADSFKAGALDGNDVIDGGLGRDTYDASAEGSNSLRIDLLTTVAQFPQTGNIDIVFGIERVIGTALSDGIVGADAAETLTGGGGNDSVYGRGGNDILYGGTGNDLLDGMDGNDVLASGVGNDILRGGAGIDVLISDYGKDTVSGGMGNDTFIFVGPLDRQPSNGPYIPDVLTDFEMGIDRIDLSSLDARSNVVGNQAFAWVGLGAVTAVGQAGYSTAGGVTKVWVYVDAALPLAQQTVIEMTGTYALTSANFML